MTFERAVQVGSPGAFFEIELRDVQSKKLEIVAMRAMAFRRTWSVVTRLAEIVQSAVTKLPRLRPLRDGVNGGRNIVEQPMVPDPAGSIGIINNQSEAFGFGRRAGPFKRRRQVGALASVQSRNRAALWKRSDDELDCHGREHHFETPLARSMYFRLATSRRITSPVLMN